ncbi:PPE family protein, partial [Mycobacterium tuberculosis 02_1987]
MTAPVWLASPPEVHSGAAKCWSGAGFVAGGRGGVERVKRRVRRCGARVERGGGPRWGPGCGRVPVLSLFVAAYVPYVACWCRPVRIARRRPVSMRPRRLAMFVRCRRCRRCRSCRPSSHACGVVATNF